MRRSAEQITRMRAAGRVVAEMHATIREALRPGVTTAELDAIGREVLERRGATSNFLGYHGYPAVICASPNDVIVHGIPGPRVLEDGDIISIDCGAVIDGWHGDAAFTAPVGDVAPEAVRLIDVTREALYAGIAQMRDGNRMGDVGAAVQGTAEAAGFSVVREYVGHGIGTAMHEKPEVPNLGVRGKGTRIKQGMTLAIEPMVNVGDPDTFLTDDGWTVVTADGSWSAHWEHTVLVTDGDPEILTVA